MCSPASKQGYAIHMYAASTSMKDCSFCNADGDFLIVPQLGLLQTPMSCSALPSVPCDSADHRPENDLLSLHPENQAMMQDAALSSLIDILL